MRALILVFAFTAVQLVPSVPTPGDQVFARFGEYVDALRTQAGIPGVAAAVVGENDILWERGFGQQDVASGVPASPDTPFYLDGLTQLFTATVVLQCAQEGRVTLSDVIGKFDADSEWAGATIAQVLSHTHGTPQAQTFSYQLERLDPLKSATRVCRGDSYRETIANLLDGLAMMSSVPGADVVTLVPPAEGVPDPATAARYSDILARLTTAYSVAAPGQVTVAQRPVTTLTPTSGLVSTVRDFAQFDLALRKAVLLRPETLELAWTPATGAGGQALPHGLGWFVQQYNGERIVWQFGVSDGASSSIVMTVPGRRLTLVLFANSDGLVKLFPMAAGDITVSPFAKVFLRLFVS